METQQICDILKIEDITEATDALELEVFELKKNVLAKPLLYKLVQPKLKRLTLLAEFATDFLPSDSMLIPSIERVKSAVPMDLWTAYMQSKSTWKRLWSQSSTPKQLIDLLYLGLELELHYATQFPELDWIEEQPLFGVEPDPMPIQKSLTGAHAKGWNSFELLESHKSELDKALLLGIKRLSLLSKFLQE